MNRPDSEQSVGPAVPSLPVPHPALLPGEPGQHVGMARGDLIAELAGRLDQLDQLLNRLEDAERQAADASAHLVHTRRWQEETVRTIQEERARMRQRQHALDELADRARAAVEAMSGTHRTLPREVHELAIELQVLDSAGFLSKRSRRRRP
jgi:DNA repair exonuclease SbcCD ATPase subunit